jgi:hypothetical protein
MFQTSGGSVTNNGCHLKDIRVLHSKKNWLHVIDAAILLALVQYCRRQHSIPNGGRHVEDVRVSVPNSDYHDAELWRFREKKISPRLSFYLHVEL